MRKFLNSVITVAILLAIALPVLHADAPAAAGVVNINSADASQLAMLPRVGQKAAQRIVEYRTQHGPFQTASDLMQVKGFGQKSFDRLSQYLTTEGKTTLAAKVKGPKKPRTKSSSRKPSTAAK
jgi:competence ComEA-like helix-hairpin-helix protein